MTKRLTGIAVTGHGTVAVQPDIAIVQLGATAEASSAATASERATAAMQAMVDAAAGAGVEERDRLTGTLRLSSWRPDIGQPARFSAHHELTLRVREVPQAGAIVQTVLAAGGDAAEVHDLRLAVEHPEAHLDQARADAMADARRKAGQLAELAGRQLGVVTAVVEDAGGIQHKSYPLEARAMVSDSSAGGSPPVEAGDLRLHAQVQVEYAWDD
ncbi:SIMPL domain-containing protein [Flindersiella endophytica]